MEAGFIGAAFGAGLLSFFSPCILPLLPIYIGILSTDADNEEVSYGRRVANTIAFVLGISTTFFIMGLGAGAIGHVLNNSYVAIVFGIVIFIFGLHLSGLIQIPLFNREKRADMSRISTKNLLGTFLLGLAFSFGWTPCVGPILGTILALAAEQGNALIGAGLMLVYSFGMSIPFLLITLASSALLVKLRSLHKYLPTIQKIGGILIAVMGLWMVVTQANYLLQHKDPFQSATATQEASSESSDTSDYAQLVPLTDLEGNTHTLSEYQGKPVYFEFFGTWCSQCMSNIDEFSEYAAEKNAEGDVVVIGVAVPGFFGEMEQDEFVEWAESQDLGFTVLMDTDAALVDYYEVQGFPTSVFINSDGTTERIRTGVIEPSEVEKVLKTLK